MADEFGILVAERQGQMTDHRSKLSARETVEKRLGARSIETGLDGAGCGRLVGGGGVRISALECGRRRLVFFWSHVEERRACPARSSSAPNGHRTPHPKQDGPH